MQVQKQTGNIIYRKSLRKDAENETSSCVRINQAMCEKTKWNDADRKIGFEIRTIHNMIGVHAERHMKSHNHDITQMQAWVIGFLYHHREEDVYQKDIEEEFRVSRATATNVLKIMERKELIVRKTEEQDKRLKKIYLTPKASAIHEDVIQDMKELEKMLVTGLSDEEVLQFKRMLGIVHTNVAKDIGKIYF